RASTNVRPNREHFMAVPLWPDIVGDVQSAKVRRSSGAGTTFEGRGCTSVSAVFTIVLHPLGFRRRYCSKIFLQGLGNLEAPCGIQDRLLLGCDLQESSLPSQRQYLLRASHPARRNRRLLPATDADGEDKSALR